MAGGHAFCAPSDWKGWSQCPGKPALEEGEPEVENEYSQEGTLAHELAAQVLRGKSVDLPADLADGIRLYTSAVQARIDAFKLAGASPVTLLVEQRLSIEEITGERGAKGTADTIIIAEFADTAVLEVWDLKFGMGVKVSPENNGQLMIYALAALIKLGILHNFTEVNLVIHQPRVFEAPQVWATSTDALYVFGQSVTEAASLSLSLRGESAALSHLNPGEEQCRFCKVKYRCPALAAQVHKEVFGEFQDLDDPAAVPLEPKDTLERPENLPARLSLALTRVPLIESWCLAVRAAVESELSQGRAVPGFKLVLGRSGARRWTDETAVEKLLLADNADPAVIFTPRKLKTPSALEKPLAKAPIWSTLQDLIDKAEGKPSVAPADDPRAPYAPPALNDFDNLEEPLA